MIGSEQIQILAQIIEAMNEAGLKMGDAIRRRRQDEYEKAKEGVLSLQQEMSKILEGGK